MGIDAQSDQDEASQLGLFFEPEPSPAPAPAIETASPAPGRKPRKTRAAGGSSLPSWAQSSLRSAKQAEPEPDPAPETESRQIWKVGDLVGTVRNHIERAYADLWVRGEISNLRAAPSGHLYFTLKDGDAQLPAVLFRRQAQLLRFRPEDGLEILLRGKVSVYEQRGQMQLIAEYLEPVGAGSLQIAFEQLKARLQQEGLFSAERKRPLPAYPHCVGIVTSPSGAVIRDFLNVANRRHAGLDVLLYPAVVQGASAAAEVAAGIAHFNRERAVQVIVIARGGGSLEDLAPFNSELLARAIAASELPVVSAIGHETDFTIADFVADLRAPTPSAAAELITAAQHRVEEQVAEFAQRLARACRYQLILARQRLERLSVEAAFAQVRGGLNRREQRIDTLRFRMETALRANLREASDKVQQAHARLLRQDLTRRLPFMREQWSALDAKLARAIERSLRAPQDRQRMLTQQLASLSPLAVLSRGYALVYDGAGALIKTAAHVQPGEALTLRLAEGTLGARALGAVPAKAESPVTEFSTETVTKSTDTAEHS